MGTTPVAIISSQAGEPPKRVRRRHRLERAHVRGVYTAYGPLIAYAAHLTLERGADDSERTVRDVEIEIDHSYTHPMAAHWLQTDVRFCERVMEDLRTEACWRHVTGGLERKLIRSGGSGRD